MTRYFRLGVQLLRKRRPLVLRERINSTIRPYIKRLMSTTCIYDVTMPDAPRNLFQNHYHQFRQLSKATQGAWELDVDSEKFKRSVGLNPSRSHCLYINNSYMIYIIINPLLWLGISAYGGGILSVYFSPDYFFRNVNKIAAWIPDNKKKKCLLLIINNYC